MIGWPRNWKPPAGLERSRPREIHLTGAGFVLLAFSVAFWIAAAAALTALVTAAAGQAEQGRLLREKGADADAVVTRLWRGSGDSRPAFAAYTFPADGRSYSGQSRAQLRVWENLKVGSVLPVRFVRANPELNVPIGWERNPMPLWLGPAVAAALAGIGLLMLIPLRTERRLLTEGRAAPGIVTGHKKTDKGTAIQFEFRLLSGATRRGKGSPGKKPASVGSSVCVLYDSENPQRHRLYPMPLVKLSGTTYLA